jgi:hypothetical protein
MVELSRKDGRPTYQLFTIGDRRFTIGSRVVPIVPPGFTSGSPLIPRGPTMKKESEIVRIDFTPEQKDFVRKEIGKDAEAVELTVHELEERIAPRIPHNVE